MAGAWSGTVPYAQFRGPQSSADVPDKSGDTAKAVIFPLSDSLSPGRLIPEAVAPFRRRHGGFPRVDIFRQLAHPDSW